MSSQQHRLQKLAAKHFEGKRTIVKVGGVAYDFRGVRWGGTSPLVCLAPPGGDPICHSAAEWKRLGAAL